MEAWWHLAWQTLQAEFADIGDARQLTQVTVRLLIAAILGGILGFEREHKGKAAGVRTHMLVALGAALFSSVASLLRRMGFVRRISESTERAFPLGYFMVAGRP